MLSFLLGSILQGAWNFFTGSWLGILLFMGGVIIFIVKIIDGE